MKKSWFLLGAVALALAGCGTNVALDEDAQDAQALGAQTSGADAGESSVTAIEAGGAGSDTLAGPVGIARVIYFDFDSYTIKPEYQPIVDDHASYLRDDRSRNVVLEGNTDERGSREYNLALGQRRAEAVRRALTLVGAYDTQIEAVSFGAENPAAGGHDEEAWAQNRRVEFHYR